MDGGIVKVVNSSPFVRQAIDLLHSYCYSNKVRERSQPAEIPANIPPPSPVPEIAVKKQTPVYKPHPINIAQAKPTPTPPKPHAATPAELKPAPLPPSSPAAPLAATSQSPSSPSYPPSQAQRAPQSAGPDRACARATSACVEGYPRMAILNPLVYSISQPSRQDNSPRIASSCQSSARSFPRCSIPPGELRCAGMLASLARPVSAGGRKKQSLTSRSQPLRLLRLPVPEHLAVRHLIRSHLLRRQRSHRRSGLDLRWRGFRLLHLRFHRCFVGLI